MTGVNIVVDASVARQCGNVVTANELSATCRASLVAIQTSSLSVVISNDIRAEWRRHASRYAWQWLVDMISRGRHLAVDPERHADLRRAMLGLATEDRRAVDKDLLLVEAALCSDKRVLSRDNTMRRILHSMSPEVEALGAVHWVGPEYDGCIEWLQNGAPSQPSIQLANRI